MPEPESPAALELLSNCLREGTAILAPPLFFAEVTSVLRQAVVTGRITADEGEEAFEMFQRTPVVSMEPPELQRTAWDLARRYRRPRAYDTQYLAVAMLAGCDLWTADRRLANAVEEPWVRRLGDGQ